MQQVHPQQSRRCVESYDGDRRYRSLSCSDQFLAMAFAQLTYREGLRDIESCLNSQSDLLHQMGFRSRIRRSTPPDAKEDRDWRIYADLAQILIAKARPLYGDEDLGLDLKGTVYALDSTTIDLCLSLFPRARFRRTKGAVKLHTLLDLRGPIQTFIEITDGKLPDVRILDLLVVEPGVYYVMDRGYLDRLPALQATLAGGAVLQVDQATPAYPKLLRHVRQRREDPGLDRHLCLRTGDHSAKRAETAPQTAQPSPTAQSERVRESTDFSTTCRSL
jgi:hypothetical protein